MNISVIGSRTDLSDTENAEVQEFLSYIADLFEAHGVQKLELYEQHRYTTRLQHCLNVAYYSYKIAKKIGADPCMAARAGMLHDLYWYDWHHNTRLPQVHVLLHPRLAVHNAVRITDITEREADAILKHMWPLYPGMPKYKESYAVTAADKLAASMELVSRFRRFIYHMFNIGQQEGNMIEDVRLGKSYA